MLTVEQILELTNGLPGLIVFGVLILGLLIQLTYFFFIFSKFAFYKSKHRKPNQPPVSVIVCGKNEDDNIIELLPSVLNQDYPTFEVVFVNDCSVDNTADVLEEFARKYAHLKIVTIKEDEYYRHGKKFALMVGIKGAKYEKLLLTDADCKPNSPNWITNMVSHFEGNTEIVLGYGGYEKRKGLLNKAIRFDTFFIALQYLSFSLCRITYMGVGRNLAYTKDLYFRNKGFASHYHIQSGDDDLFINEVARKNNVNVEVEVESFTISKAKRKFSDWVRQKRRHLTTGKHYKPLHRFLLALFPVGQWLFLGAFITLILLQVQLYVALGIFVLRYLIQFLIFNRAMKRLDEKDLLLWSPLLELFLLFFYPYVAIAGIFQKKNRWS